MPKIVKEKPKQFKYQPYTKVTYNSQALFKELKSEDQTNLTTVNRSTVNYAEFLGLDESLPKMIQSLKAAKGKKVTILDSGCGSGRVINWLLSDPKLNDAIESMTGISLHYFKPIREIMYKHGERFKYYNGTAESVLGSDASTTESFDLIFDVWGPFKYSEDKLALLKLYHQALKPNAKALIFSGDEEDLFILDDKREKVNFFKWVTSKFPETFECKMSKQGSVLEIKKSAPRWMLPDCKITSRNELSSRSDLRLSPEKLRESNVMYFKEVVFEPEAPPARNLRSLKYKA